nr:hypothetical protein [uncultured Mediterranean phage uvMED]
MFNIFKKPIPEDVLSVAREAREREAREKDKREREKSKKAA